MMKELIATQPKFLIIQSAGNNFADERSNGGTSFITNGWYRNFIITVAAVGID
jgi:hypothetical protein